LKHLILCLALGAGLLGGCSASQTTQTTAGLSGTYDLAAAGDFIFVTSADRNELRVLDLNASPRDWKRAPNPLEPLSVPVLKRPLYLTRDVRYDAQGNEVTGGDPEAGLPFAYVYARSSGTEEISVVSADPAYFKELKRLTGLGFVTAFAARGADKESDPRILYYATQDETGAKLFRLALPGPEELLASGGAPLVGTQISLTTTLQDEAVIALLVLRAPAGQERLVVATRKTSPTATLGDRTFRLDMTTDAQGATTVTGSVEYKFGGPVRLLASHPRVSNLNLDADECDLDDSVPPKSTQNADGSLDAGTYVFGVLDETVCTTADQEACSGILAVESDTGEVPVDSTGSRMLPIRVGQALPTGLTLAADARLLVRCKGGSVIQRRPLIGIVPASDGRISIFDAAKLRSFDLNVETVSSTGEVLTTGAAGESGHAVIDSTGTAKTTRNPANQYISLRVEEGATRDETFRAIYEGALQGLVARPLTEGTCTDAGCSFVVDANAVKEGSGGALPMVRSGDIVSLINPDGNACPRETDLTVTATRVDTLPDSRQLGVLTTGPLSGDCAGPSRFTVRASAQYPLVVYSDATGYQGRMAVADGELPIPGGYIFHPVNFHTPDTGKALFVENPAFRTVGAYLRLTNPESLELVRGDQIVVTAESGLLPFAASVDTATTTAGLSAFRLPGPVVHTKVGDVDFAYIAYPSADGILQVSLGGLVDNVANIRGLVPFQ
jgi:hypothetical protein